MDWRTTLLDEPSQWPQGPVVPLDPPHADARGKIQSLVNFPAKNVSLITSAANTLRSNHYHKTDWHYMYVMSGSFDYYYRPTGSQAPPQKVTVGPGEMIFTPPLEDHATVFLEECQFIVVSRNPRDQATYEADTVRIELIDPAPYMSVVAQ